MIARHSLADDEPDFARADGHDAACDHAPAETPLNYAALARVFAQLRQETCVPAILRSLGASFPKDVALRASHEADAAALMTLFNDPDVRDAALTRDPFESPGAFQDWRRSLCATDAYEIVAERAGTLAGFIGLYPQPDHMRHSGFVTLAVGPEHRQRGIGRTLLHLALVTAWLAAGLSKVQLTVFTDNEAALRLYEGTGFEIEGRVRSFVRQRGIDRDAYLMALFLE